MSRSYPIWNEITACIYKSGKSYGARDTSECAVKVGTSASNSELLVRHCTTKRQKGGFLIFRFSVDTGHGFDILATKWMNAKTREWFDTMPAELSELYLNERSAQ